jgi:hypothetical protein
MILRWRLDSIVKLFGPAALLAIALGFSPTPASG